MAKKKSTKSTARPRDGAGRFIKVTPKNIDQWNRKQLSLRSPQVSSLAGSSQRPTTKTKSAAPKPKTAPNAAKPTPKPAKPLPKPAKPSPKPAKASPKPTKLLPKPSRKPAKPTPKPAKPLPKPAKQSTPTKPSAAKPSPNPTPLSFGLPKGSRTLKGPKKAPRKPVQLILQQERVKVPGIQGTARKADKYRYPKGHPKAGQYAPASEAKGAKVTRVVRRRGGRREALEPKGRGKVRPIKGQTVNIGRAFTTTTAAYTAIDAVNEAAANGRKVFVKVGGRILDIPAGRQLDAAAWLSDLKARFISEAPRNTAGKGYPFSLELSTGPAGYLVNLDRMEYFTPELRQELGPLSEARELAADLAEYIEQTAAQYLGATIPARDILEAWEGEGSAPSEDDEE